ncbi:unnamed protein product [Prorocentrum cordatum]|uniref:Uncharacterized protein n=1 Tax=Prorocentrum cordatum TaxID=2364126 RepID=A0ABN9XK47_9DINO|nr:unnamed protein product [Polarella glacialis]
MKKKTLETCEWAKPSRGLSPRGHTQRLPTVLRSPISGATANTRPRSARSRALLRSGSAGTGRKHRRSEAEWFTPRTAKEDGRGGGRLEERELKE